MQISVANVIIHKDAMTKVSKQVFPWELPVLEAKFGEGGFTRRDDTEVEIAELPDAVTAMQKLAKAHGGDSQLKMSYAEIAYGKGSLGLKALKEVISEASGTKKPKRKKAAPKKAEVEEEGEPQGDPLGMG